MFRAILLLCATGYVFAGPIGDKCKITDKVCMVKVTNIVYRWFFSNENHLDPTHHDVIEGNPGKLHYKLTDVVAHGFNNCTIIDSSMDIPNVHFEVSLLCFRLTLEGKYNMNGELFNLPLEGSGNFMVETGKYLINHHMSIELEGTDTKTQFQIKNYTFDAEPLDKITYKFENLLEGKTDQVEAVKKYVDDNWKTFAKEVQDPFFLAQLEKITELANKYFKTSYLQRSFIL